MDAIERIEISVRAALSNVIAPRPGAHWYMSKAPFNRAFDHTSRRPARQDGLPGRLENPADLGLAVGSSHVGSIYPLGTSYVSSQHLAGHNPLVTASM
jgi:hypothetical protein